MAPTTSTGCSYRDLSSHKNISISGWHIFAGTDNGVLHSTNNGLNWTAVNSGLTDTAVNALAISGSNLFAGAQSGGVFLSSDNGASWISVNDGLLTKEVNCLIVSNGYIYAGTALGGVFRSPLP
jgi:photosystem II stability/assembly factor-like uncharacterized protein